MPVASDPRLSGTSAAAVALIAAAGFVDAHIYLHVAHVFVANMSGNLVLLGMATGAHEWKAGAHQAAALAAFIGGSFVASRFHSRRRREGRALRPDLLLAADALMLLAVAGWVLLLNHDHAGERLIVYPAVIVAAFAMGMQNSVILRVGATAVSTTYATGSVTRFGSEIAFAFGDASAADSERSREALPILAALIAAYVIGAAVAASVGSSAGWLLLPAVVLGSTAFVMGRRIHSET